MSDSVHLSHTATYFSVGSTAHFKNEHANPLTCDGSVGTWEHEPCHTDVKLGARPLTLHEKLMWNVFFLFLAERTLFV